MPEPTVFTDNWLPDRLRGRPVACLSTDELWEMASIARALVEPAFRRAARRRMRCEQTVQDVVQESLLRFASGKTLGRHLGEVSVEKAFLSMLESVARSHARSCMRSREVVVPENLTSARDPEAQLLDRIDRERLEGRVLRDASDLLQAWWATLSPRERLVVSDWWRGHPADAIARRRGMSRGAVYARLCSARKRLSEGERATLDAAVAIRELRGVNAPHAPTDVPLAARHQRPPHPLRG